MAEAARTGWVRPDPAIFGEAVTWEPYKGAPGARLLLTQAVADLVLAEVPAWKIAGGKVGSDLPSWVLPAALAVGAFLLLRR
jgi:hypothetical protein